MPFEPGNKHGRGRPPAGKSLSEALRVALTEKLPDGRNKYRVIADVLVDKACAGDIAAIREVLDRTEGKPTSVLSLEHQGPRPIMVQILEMDLKTL